METIHLFGDDAQKAQWLEPPRRPHPLAFAMTEPRVASSDVLIERETATVARHQRPQVVGQRRERTRAARSSS